MDEGFSCLAHIPDIQSVFSQTHILTVSLLSRSLAISAALPAISANAFFLFSQSPAGHPSTLQYQDLS